MNTSQKFRRAIATFFLLIFFPTLVPQSLYASNNGPKSPEAASFEPVDATDMVNLITGQYSYVLPLLNVPSPEGGYPLAMGYHAGIAMDQEASWAGLGWNVNPGAIDRSISGFPDDYKASQVNEYFYDKGKKEYVSYASIGWSLGLASVGVGFNWGSSQSLGGYVSMGVGMQLSGAVSVGVESQVGFGSSAGQNSFGINAQIGMSGGGALSVGLTLGSGGSAQFSAGFDSNGTGISISGNNNGSMSLSSTIGGVKALGFTLSSSGRFSGISVLGVGYSSTSGGMSEKDYIMAWKDSDFTLSIPTPIGIFSLGGGRQTFSYSLSVNKNSYVSGPLNFHKGVANLTGYAWDGFGGWMSVVYGRAFMDKYELTNLGATETSVDSSDNLAFPSYDTFNVQAQGISGTMSTVFFESGALFGVDGREYNERFKLNYPVGGGIQSYLDATKFVNRPEFYFTNEISTYSGFADASIAMFNPDPAITNPCYYYGSGADHSYKPKRKTSNFIEYFTNEEISPTPTSSTFNIITGEWSWGNPAPIVSHPSQKGYLKPNVSGFDRNLMPRDGIGAFKITAPDGKTYHYSLPVYNLEMITRSFGSIEERRQENQSYFEKRQMEPYATHWLLTAVTGPDFVDDGDGMAGEGDLGYWVSFEYGKWTDAFVWKAPYKKDYLENEEDPNVKTWIKGRKQLYYLDKIKTRTHTALFIKSERQDAASEVFSYKSVKHISGYQGQGQSEADYVERFSIPAQKQLRLDKIILLKNSDENVDKLQGGFSTTNIDYNSGYGLVLTNPYGENDGSIGKKETAIYNCRKYVLDDQDNWQGCIPKAMKIIDFAYDYSLVSGDNRLTLKSVDFKGKAGAGVIPPYKFDYINNVSSFNINNMDYWGYLNSAPETWSLNKITTPQGGTINIKYEPHVYQPVIKQTVRFTFKDNSKYHTSVPSFSSPNDIRNKKIIIENKTIQQYGFNLGTKVKIDYHDWGCIGGRMRKIDYASTGTITANLGQGKYEVTFDYDVLIQLDPQYTSHPDCTTTGTRISNSGENWQYFITADVIMGSGNNPLTGAGVRVSSLNVSDGINNYVTDYKYGNNEDGKGYVTYVPNLPSVLREIPLSSELPPPRIMYEYVTMSSRKQGMPSNGKIRYKFNILKEKAPNNNFKFGDFYEIEMKTPVGFTNADGKAVTIRSNIVKDNLASIGRVLEVSTLNSQGDILSVIKNDYYKPADLPNKMGVTQESYQSYKSIDYIGNYSALQDKILLSSSTRVKYPSVLKSVGKQSDGHYTFTEFGDYDLISGVSKEQITTTSDGKKIKKTIVPAFRKYPQMGSKAEILPLSVITYLEWQQYYKNMLTQVAAEYTYIYDPTDANKPWKETGVGITTWSNDWLYQDIEGNLDVKPVLDFWSPGFDAEKVLAYEKKQVWRKHKAYTWNGLKDNGIFLNFDSNTDDGFDWTVGVGAQPLKWKQISEITKFDPFSKVLELKDINNNHIATKMGDNNTKITAVGNAKYNELYYSGMENLKQNSAWLEPGIKITGNICLPGLAHTGVYAVRTTNASKLSINLIDNHHKAGRYKLNVWVHKSNAANARISYAGGAAVPFNGGVGETKQAGDWILKTHYLNNVPASNTEVYLTSADGTEVVYDDVMLRPLGSSVTGYVYNEWDELSYIIGNNGLGTRFEYDKAGRLVKTYVEVFDDQANGLIGGFKLSSENKMKYKNL